MAREIFVQTTPQGVLITSPIFREWEEVEVIQDGERIILQPRRAVERCPIAHHPAFGLWADREEGDSVQLADTLRRRVEHRRDVSS